MATRQEILTQIVEFYEQGGKPGYSHDGEGTVCSYYVSSLKRCAFGCYVDVEIAQRLEDIGIGTVYDIYVYLSAEDDGNKVSISEEMSGYRDYLMSKLPTDCCPAKGVEFLASVQAAHDYVAGKKDEEGEEFVDRFKRRLVAKQDELTLYDGEFDVAALLGVCEA